MSRSMGGFEDGRTGAPGAGHRILEMLYGCGVRVSELVGLDIRDIDWDRGLDPGPREG
jgi:integrase